MVLNHKKRFIFFNRVLIIAVEGKFICDGGEVAIDQDKVCDGNFDCPEGNYPYPKDESAWECASAGEYYVKLFYVF